MGYCMSQRECRFRIRSAGLEDAMKAVQALDGGKRYSWVNPGFGKEPNLEDMLNDWRWAVSSEPDGTIIDITFEGEKLGDDEILFQALAPFVEAGSYIEMQGEDGSMWRWVFDGQTVKEVSAKISWE